MKYGLLAGLAFTAASHASIDLKANEQPLGEQGEAVTQSEVNPPGITYQLCSTLRIFTPERAT
ncbi:hypothetical protein ACMFY2_11095 [Enterobacter cloacae subsp. cloacae]